MFWKLLMLAIFAAITIGIGIMTRKKASGIGSFVLGGRDVGPWLTAFAYGTSYFSAVVFVGYAGQFGWNFGVASTWIGIGNALIGSLLAWVVLARRTRVMTRHFDSATMPDFFAKRYRSESLRIVVSAIIFIFLVPYSASVYKGLSGLFSMSFGIDYNWCIIGIAVITGAYVILGGYLATALNDLVQGIIMIVGIIAVIAAVLNQNGGFTESLRLLSQIEVEGNESLLGGYTSFFGPDPLGLLSVVILTSLGTWGLPQMIHKFYTIKNEKAIQAGTVISTGFAFLIAGGSYFIGGFGRLFYQGDNGQVVFDNIIPEMLSDSLPNLMIGLVLILVLSASMSTLSSLVLTSSSTLALDFIKKFRKKEQSEKKDLLSIRILCAFFVALSAILALNPNSLITSLMSLSWGTLAGCFLGPFLWGLFYKKATRASVFFAIACGLVLNVGNLLVPVTSSLKMGALSMIVSVVAVPLVSLFTKKMPEKEVEADFACFEEKITVSHHYALTGEED